MRTVNIGELKNQLSGYLQHVKNGEEVVATCVLLSGDAQLLLAACQAGFQTVTV